MSSFYNVKILFLFLKKYPLPSHCPDTSLSSPHLCTDAVTLLARSQVSSLWNPPVGPQVLGSLHENLSLGLSLPLQPLSQRGTDTRALTCRCFKLPPSAGENMIVTALQHTWSFTLIPNAPGVQTDTDPQEGSCLAFESV